jgi:hypothetical protein
MQTIAALALSLCLIGGAALGTLLFPHANRPSEQADPRHVTIPLSGKIIALREGAFALQGPSTAEPLWIAYDDKTFMLARPERIEGGAVTGSRLVVVEPSEILVVGMTLRATLYGTDAQGAPYAFSLIALPVY